MKQRSKNFSIFLGVLAAAVLLDACDNNARRPGRGSTDPQRRQEQRLAGNGTQAFMGNGRHALALLKRNGKPTNAFNYQTTGGGNPTGNGAAYGGSKTGAGGQPGSNAGGPAYGGSQANGQPTNGAVSSNVNQLPGLYGQTAVEGLHVLRLYNNGSNGINPYLYQGRDTGRSLAMRVETESRVAVTTDGSGFAVSQPSDGLVQVGEFSKEGELYQQARFSFRRPTIVESMRTVMGELVAVVHSDNQIAFFQIVPNAQGRIQFLRVANSFKPAGITSKITSLKFSPGGQYIYVATAINPNAANIGGELVVCDIPTILSRPQDSQRAAAESIVYGGGCFPGDPGLGYNRPGQNGQLYPGFPSYVGTQKLQIVPDGLIVNWDLVGVWNSVRGASILQPPNTGEHNNNLALKLGIVGPTQVVQYRPLALGNDLNQGVFGYQFRFALAHPRNNNIILFGNKQSTTESFLRVLSTENIVNFGRELDNYALGTGLITSVEQDIGALNDDYTPTLNGEFVLVGRDSGVIHVMSYVEDFKSITHNGPLYDIPVYGFDAVDMAIRTSTPFVTSNIPIDELLDKEEDPPVS